MRRQSIYSQKGFTLPEVLVTILIFSVLAAAIQSVLMVGQSSWAANSTRLELIQELRKAMAVMEDELRQTGPTAITAGPVDADSTVYDSITFYLPDGISGGAIDWASNTTQYVLGGADSNELQRIEGANTTVIARNISSLGFFRQNGSADIISVSLQAQKNTADNRTMAIDFGFNVQMRN